MTTSRRVVPFILITVLIDAIGFGIILPGPTLAWFTAAGHPHWPGAPFAIAALFVVLTFATLSQIPRRSPAA